MIVAAAAIGAALISMRHQKFELTYQVAELHGQLHETRYALWQMQTQIAGHLEPAAMRASIARAELDLEPINPAGAAVVRPRMAASR